MHKLPVVPSKRGIFINQVKSQCSIYEAGIMVYNAIKSNLPEYTLDYVETNASLRGYNMHTQYDFQIINWHPITLNIPLSVIRSMTGLKIAVVLEVTPESPFVYVPDNWFDAYMVIDPTKTKSKNIFPFPRPLEYVEKLKPLISNSRIVIGSFGFLVPNGPALEYKRFHEVVENANKIGNCLVRFNFPAGTFTGVSVSSLSDYGNKLRGLASNGVDVQVTHQYFSKIELINWCAENTINAFPYYRDLPGLSATTDQAISANRPIAISESIAFRHMRPYIMSTQQQSYLELIKSTPPGIKRMQEDWSISKFNNKFRELLLEYGLL